MTVEKQLEKVKNSTETEYLYNLLILVEPNYNLRITYRGKNYSVQYIIQVKSLYSTVFVCKKN